jgi:hypothetical protein
MTGLWLLLGIGGAMVWAGQQYILRQQEGTIWFSDPYQFDSYGTPGTGMFYEGELPPGEAPPWRLASEAEMAALDRMETTGM